MQIDEAIELLEKARYGIAAIQPIDRLDQKDRLIDQALAKLREIQEPKLCICCEEITEENAHLHRNCGK